MKEKTKVRNNLVRLGSTLNVKSAKAALSAPTTV